MKKIMQGLRSDAVSSGSFAAEFHRRYASYIKYQTGKIGYILLWLMGVPIPVLFLIFLLRGCD